MAIEITHHAHGLCYVEDTDSFRLLFKTEVEYVVGNVRANYPVPAICNHLDLIAAEPLQVWEDFNAIGWHGLYARKGKAF